MKIYKFVFLILCLVYIKAETYNYEVDSKEFPSNEINYSVESLLSLLKTKLSEKSFEEIEEAFRTIDKYLPFNIVQKFTNIEVLRVKKHEFSATGNPNEGFLKVKESMLSKLENELISMLLVEITEEMPTLFKDHIKNILETDPQKMKKLSNMLEEDYPLRLILLDLMEEKVDN